MPLTHLKTPEDVQELLAGSGREPVFLLKHSSQCPISADVYSAFSEFEQQGGANRPWTCALVRVIEERPLSDRIAEQLGVRHESPQLLLISGSKVLWHDSHLRLTLEKMNEVAGRFLQS